MTSPHASSQCPQLRRRAGVLVFWREAKLGIPLRPRAMRWQQRNRSTKVMGTESIFKTQACVLHSQLKTTISTLWDTADCDNLTGLIPFIKTVWDGCMLEIHISLFNIIRGSPRLNCWCRVMITLEVILVSQLNCIALPCNKAATHDDVIKWKHFRVTGLLCGEFTAHR